MLPVEALAPRQARTVQERSAFSRPQARMGPNLDRWKTRTPGRRSSMYRLLSAATIACLPLLLGGCNDAVRPLAPQLESQIAGGEQRRVQMLDACDPESFNTAIGPGTCIRQGGLDFAKFISLLGRHQKVGAWHFAPATLHVRVGQELLD